MTGTLCLGGLLLTALPVAVAGDVITADREFLTTAGAVATVAKASSDRARARKALQRALAWMMKQQGKDGSWRSVTYGNMRGGASITTLTLYAVSHVPVDLHKSHRKSILKAYRFLERGIREKGFVVVPKDGSLDYPGYGTAMLLIAARRLDLPLAGAEFEQAVTFLLKEQRHERNGFKPASVEYGGWDLASGAKLYGVTTGTNISVTSYILEAITPLKAPKITAARKRATKWLQGCQNLPGDGGFFFHPKRDHLGNKAEWLDKKGENPRSYGSPTCDGLRAMVALGISQKDKRFQAALKWLDARYASKVVPGFDKVSKPSKTWRDGLRYYYHSRLASLLPLLSKKTREFRRRELLDFLLKEQKPDGSWKNESNRMREDDPLIATAFAVVAIADLLKQVPDTADEERKKAALRGERQ